MLCMQCPSDNRQPARKFAVPHSTVYSILCEAHIAALVERIDAFVAAERARVLGGPLTEAFPCPERWGGR